MSRKVTIAVLVVFVASAIYAIYLFARILSQPRDAAANATLLTAVVAIGAGALVVYQVDLLRKQTQLDAIIRLDQEWRCDQMVRNRELAWKDEMHADEDTVEGVLEFLERVSTFANRGMIDRNLVWDTFGWYMVRYYSYCKNEIEVLRERWTNRYDGTLYQELEALYKALLDKEAEPRHITPAEVEKELMNKRALFIKTERNPQPND
jgi:hypothetical protein